MIFNNKNDLTLLEKLIGKQNDFIYEKYKNFHKTKFKKISDEVFSLFVEQLNKNHNSVLSKKSWIIIIGPWFYSFFNIYFYYNYCFSKKNSINKKIAKIILNINFKRNDFTSLDFSEYVQSVNSREYLIKFIYTMLSSNFSDLSINIIKLKKNSFVKNLFLKFFIITGNLKVILSRPRFNKIDQLKIYIFSGFKILCIPAFDQIFNVILLKNRNNTRKLIIRNLDKKLKHYNIIKILFYFIPTAYLENFKEYENAGKKILPDSQIIYSDTTYISDEVFKIQLAKSKSKKYIGQHGGNFRIYGKNQINVHENDIADKYIVWGKTFKKKEVMLSSPKINSFYHKYKNINKKKKQKQYYFFYILQQLKYSNLNFFFNKSSNELLEIKKRSHFFNSVDKNFIIKTYAEEKRYLDQIPHNRHSKLFELHKNKFSNNNDVLFDSNLLVFDYMSTMIFEIISLNIPFILILDVKNHNFTDYGKKLINYLTEMNILFKNHKQAAIFFNSNKDKNIISCWSTYKNKCMLKKIALEYCSVDKNCLNQWIKFFNKII